MNRYLALARRGRNSWWRYLATCAVAMVVGVVLCIAAFLPLQLSGWAADLAQQLTSPSRPGPFLVATGAMFGSLALGLVLAARWIQGKRFGDLTGRWDWRLFGAGVGAWTAVSLAALLVDWLASPQSFRVTASSETPALAAFALVGLAPQVFAEELIFRGLVTQGLLLAFRREAPTVLASGLIFGAMHIPNGAAQAASATLFGVAMALIAIRTAGLALGTGIHLANNIFGAVVVVSANDVFSGLPALLTQDSPHLVWFDLTLSAAGLILVAAIAVRHAAKSDEFAYLASEH